ncbi:pseudouridine synthase [Blastopirellula retiformator]|uniref:Pseudouridine synthase n=1 Tax=Blastopirellula retiformator TaxID=2527970 RepID=A0A5C5V0X0_9BACT|nr:pseudouridine synthase [Blastopirellula retiformator]TWT32031.1 Ribosomal large subunit pseudouridine synthase B [Blastopirellula retiformator]
MTPKPTESDNPAPGRLQRLHKVLAFAGIDSRRKCEEMIQEGRVEVDGEFVTELGMKVDPDRQEILVDGQKLKFGKRIYYMLNKPPGVLSTNFDPEGRTRVIDMVPQDVRLFTIGRLDRASEGLIVVTNDGELANRLAHPRYEIEKTYRVEVAGHPEQSALSVVRRGVYFAEGFVKPVSLVIKRKNKQSTSLEIILDEGKNREIRRLMAKIGHKVLRLKRIAMGPLRLGEMPDGAFRELKAAEVKALRDAAFGGPGSKPKKKQTPRPPRDEQGSRGEQRPRDERRKPSTTGKPKRKQSGPAAKEERPRKYGKTIGGDSGPSSYGKSSAPQKRRGADKSDRRPAKGRGFSEAFGADDDDDDEGRPISELGWFSGGDERPAKKKAAPKRAGDPPKKKFSKKGTGFKGGAKKGGPKKGAPKKKKTSYGQSSPEEGTKGGRKAKRGGVRTKFVKNPDAKKRTTSNKPKKKKTKRRK